MNIRSDIPLGKYVYNKPSSVTDLRAAVGPSYK